MLSITWRGHCQGHAVTSLVSVNILDISSRTVDYFIVSILKLVTATLKALVYSVIGTSLEVTLESSTKLIEIKTSRLGFRDI